VKDCQRHLIPVVFCLFAQLLELAVLWLVVAKFLFVKQFHIICKINFSINIFINVPVMDVHVHRNHICVCQLIEKLSLPIQLVFHLQ
jgi:hypothetical protein